MEYAACRELVSCCEMDDRRQRTTRLIPYYECLALYSICRDVNLDDSLPSGQRKRTKRDFIFNPAGIRWNDVPFALGNAIEVYDRLLCSAVSCSGSRNYSFGKTSSKLYRKKPKQNLESLVNKTTHIIPRPIHPEYSYSCNQHDPDSPPKHKILSSDNRTCTLLLLNKLNND